jgi:hypothetical protein
MLRKNFYIFVLKVFIILLKCFPIFCISSDEELTTLEEENTSPLDSLGIYKDIGDILTSKKTLRAKQLLIEKQFG